MVFGQSGSGKSTSLRNFTPDEVCIINVSGKPLPFKNQHKTFNCDNYMEIDRAVKVAPTRAIIIDDATYLMTNEYAGGQDLRLSEVYGHGPQFLDPGPDGDPAAGG